MVTRAGVPVDSELQIGADTTTIHDAVFGVDNTISGGDGFRILADLSEVLTDWTVLPRSSIANAVGILMAPIVFRAGNRLFDAFNELDALANGEYRIVIPGILGDIDNGDLQINVTNMTLSDLRTFDQFSGVYYGLYVEFNSVITFNGQAPSDVSRQILNRINRTYLRGRTLQLQKVEADKTTKTIYPQVPGPVREGIWIQPQDVIGDFATLALTGEQLLETVSQRNVTIRTTYREELEDLDTGIEWGMDTLGIPILWRIVTSTRIENSELMELQLTTAVL